MNPTRNAKTILVPIDFSPTSLNGLEHAVELARRLGSSLHLIHVVEFDPTRQAMGIGVDWYRPETRGELERKLDEIIATRVDSSIPATSEVLVDHEVGSSIIAAAERLHAGMIVMGTHGRRGIPRLFLGSVARRVAREAGCPVLTTRSGLKAATAA